MHSDRPPRRHLVRAPRLSKARPRCVVNRLSLASGNGSGDQDPVDGLGEPEAGQVGEEFPVVAEVGEFVEGVERVLPEPCEQAVVGSSPIVSSNSHIDSATNAVGREHRVVMRPLTKSFESQPVSNLGLAAVA